MYARTMRRISEVQCTISGFLSCMYTSGPYKVHFLAKLINRGIISKILNCANKSAYVGGLLSFTVKPHIKKSGFIICTNKSGINKADL